MPDYRTPGEFLLGTLTGALELHGLGARVGLLPAENFPEHAGGVGILVGLERARRPAAAWLLTEMGCAWVRDHDIGVEAHLRGKLLPAPPLPPVPVTSADCARSAEGAKVVPCKACATCKAVAPVESYSWWNRRLGKRSPYCPACNRARINAARAASRVPATAGR